MFKADPSLTESFRRKIRKRHAIAEMAELSGFPIKQTDKNSHLQVKNTSRAGG